jgi:2-keto-4-pentenoate hydratase/2-oxohepta-3-ene-1,7-dioic acid hydratase in catechol pathway
MKFVTATHHNGNPFVGLVYKENIIDLQQLDEVYNGGPSQIPNTLIECIEHGDAFLKKVNELLNSLSLKEEASEAFYSFHEVTMHAPIPVPRKNIFCVGKNYREHAIEMGSEQDIPEDIIIFTKAPTTVTGPNATIPNYKNLTNQLDYEGELAVVIGKRGKEIKEEEALDYVFGYTIINDITARDMQSRHKQYFLGKSLDCTCPMGPWIVHKSVIANPNALQIETKVNGEIRQQSSTNHLIFPIEKIISILSRGMTLEAGDIIATGTPAGVGKGFKPPRFLKSGDEIEITVEHIGTLINRIE